MNLTVSDEIYLENPDMKFFSPQKKNLIEKSKREQLKKSIKNTLTLTTKVDNSEIE